MDNLRHRLGVVSALFLERDTPVPGSMRDAPQTPDRRRELWKTTVSTSTRPVSILPAALRVTTPSTCVFACTARADSTGLPGSELRLEDTALSRRGPVKHHNQPGLSSVEDDPGVSESRLHMARDGSSWNLSETLARDYVNLNQRVTLQVRWMTLPGCRYTSKCMCKTTSVTGTRVWTT